MRSISIAFAALVGAAAANPVEWPRNYEYGNYYSTGVSSSTVESSSSYIQSSQSSSVASSSQSEYPHPPLSTGVSSGYPPHPSSSKPDYPHPPLSTGVSEYPLPPIPTGYSSHYPLPPIPTGYSSHYPLPPIPTGYSDKPPHPTGYPTGYPNTETEVLTTYTTTTVCPVTTTRGTEVITTTTTSTIVVTSCKAGCHHKPTPVPEPTDVLPPYSGGDKPVTVPVTVTTTTYSFVPCSTSVGHNGGDVIYSTYLTASYYPTTYVTDTVIYKPTPAPQPPVITPAGNPDTCPPPVTVYQTVTLTVGQPPAGDYETKTYTVTEHGSIETITVTVPVKPGKPTYEPQPPHTNEPAPPHSTDAPKPPFPTGGTSSYIPHPTGDVPYPTGGQHSSIIYSESSRAGPQPTGYHYGGWY